MGYSVFISYSTHDLEYAKLVQRSLQIVGFSAFLAENSLGAGEELSKIHDHIKRCHSFVVLWSVDASKSAWVRDEVGAAKGANRAVIPVLLSLDVPLPPSVSNVKYISGLKRDAASILDIQSAVLVHYQLLLKLHQQQSQLWEAERQRQQAENNKAGLVVLSLGAAALLALGLAPSK